MEYRSMRRFDEVDQRFVRLILIEQTWLITDDFDFPDEERKERFWSSEYHRNIRLIFALWNNKDLIVDRRECILERSRTIESMNISHAEIRLTRSRLSWIRSESFKEMFKYRDSNESIHWRNSCSLLVINRLPSCSWTISRAGYMPKYFQ